jgi:hypothetical protein
MTTMTAMKIAPDVVTAQRFKLWLITTCFTHTNWQKAHTMHTMSSDKILGILDKAENGEKVNPSRKPLYTTLHSLCKHNGTGHASLK